MSRKFIQITFSILLLAGMVLGFALKDGVLAQDNPSAKFEAGLVDKLVAGPADFFVVMAEQADVSAANQLQSKAEKGQYVFDTLVSTANRTQANLRSFLDSQGVDYKSYYIVNTLLVKQGTLDLANSIAARGDVSAIEINHSYQLEEPMVDPAAPNVPEAVEPNISFVKADQVWALGVTGEGSVVASNDTGLYWSHPALVRQYRGCQNPPDCTIVDHNFNWWDATGTYPNEPNDGHGHGTHTSGTMVGDDGGDNQIGMAPGARLVACKNMDNGGYGQDQWFLDCFEWDLAPWDLSGNNANPNLAPDAINNSWGYGGGGQNQFRTAVDNLMAAGIIVEVSAGNEGSGCQSLRSPGDYAEVFTTGSINHAGGVLPGTLTGFSSRGPSVLDPGFFPDFMAPGENIRSSVPGGGYQGGWSGTSMAGPHVTALIGLLWSANPAIRGQVDTTYEIIQQTVVPLSGQFGSNCGGEYTVGPNNDWGYGTIDSLSAVQLAITMGGAGYLDGTVTDAVTGDPIEGANVHALHEGGFGRDAQTDPTGYYTMTVAAGLFEVTASDLKYESMTISGVEVITDEVTTLPFELTPRGELTGKVTDFDNGFALVGATVTADDGTTTTTDDNGDYVLYLDEGTHDVTASMKDYADLTETVDMVSGQTTMQDFALQAAVVFIPSPLHVTVDMESTSSVDASILNRQNVEYPFEFQEKDEGYVPALDGQFKLDVKGSSATAPAGSAVAAGPYQPRLDGQLAINRHNSINQATVLLVEADDDTPGGSPIQQALLAYGDLGAVDMYDARSGTPDLDLLQNYNVVVLWSNYVYLDATAMGNIMADYVDAGGKVIDLMFSLDPSWGIQGRFRTEGYTAMTGSGTSYINSCLGTFDPSNPIMDGISNVCDLYREYGTSLTAGSSEVARWQDNELFVAAKDDGSVVSINSYAGIYYLYTGQLPDVLHNAINFISVPPDVPWLGEDPVAATVPAESELPVTVYFSATQAVGINQPGDYMATLKLNGTPKVEVPVVMTVPAPETWGKVEGVVTDFCSGEPIEEAMLSIPDGVPITQTLTNEAGIYSIWLEAGSYDATFSAAGFVDSPATLDITPGETTILDVALKPAFGCLTFDPNSFEATLEMGDTTSFELNLGNVGGADLPFSLAEVNPSFTPASKGGWNEYLAQPAPLPAGVAVHNGPINSTVNRAPYIHHGTAPQSMSLIVYADDDQRTPTAVEIALDTLGLTYTFYGYDGSGANLSAFTTDLSTGDWDYAIYAADSWALIDASDYEAMRVHIANGGLGIVTSWAVGYDASHMNHALWTELGVEFGSWLQSPAPMYWWDPSHPILNGVPEFTDLTNLGYVAYGAKMNLEGTMPAVALGGFTASPEDNQDGVVLRNDNKSIYKGLTDNLNGADLNSNGILDTAEWWTNAINWLLNPVSDVPWLSESPITGTIAVDGSQLVDVTFDASVVNQPGTYKADIKINVSSPYPGGIVNATMIVPPPPTWGKFDGTVTDICTGALLKDVQVSIDGGVPITQTFTDAAGYYFAWIEQGNYDVNFSLPGYIAMDGSVDILPGEVTTLNVELVPDRPCIKVSPDMIEAWVLTDTQVYTTEGLMIADPGAQDLTFDISEREILPGSTGAPTVSEALGSPVVPAGSSTNNPVQPRTAHTNLAEILVLTSTDVSQSIERSLNDLGLPYDLIYKYGGDIGGTDFTPYSFVILGMDGGAFTVGDIQYLRENVIDAGKRLIFMGGTCWTDFANGVNTYLVGNDIGNYCWQISSTPNWTLTDPAHGLATDLPDSYNFANSSAAYYSIRVTDDTAEVVGINGDDWPMYFYKGDYGVGDFIWLIDSAYSYYWQDANDYAFFKQALFNAINYTGVKPDVPWIWEVPVSGTVPAGTVADIGIFLTSQYTDGTPMPLGTYTATLTITNDDPIAPKPKIPVIMHIVKEYLAPVPEFTASEVEVGNPTEFVNTSDPGIPPTKEYVWDFGDSTSLTVGTMDPVYHTYSTFGTFTATLTACNVMGCETVVHDVMVLPKVLYLPLMQKN